MESLDYVSSHDDLNRSGVVLLSELRNIEKLAITGDEMEGGKVAE